MRKKLPPKVFMFSSISILVFGLIVLGALYYILNIQYHSQTGYSLLSGPVTTPPKSLRMDLGKPDDDTLSFESSIIVSGSTGPNLTVLITTDSSDLVVKSGLDGNFSTIVNLAEGVNKITATVFDVTGDNRSAERTVYYSKEKI